MQRIKCNLELEAEFIKFWQFCFSEIVIDISRDAVSHVTAGQLTGQCGGQSVIVALQSTVYSAGTARANTAHVTLWRQLRDLSAAKNTFCYVTRVSTGADVLRFVYFSTSLVK